MSRLLTLALLAAALLGPASASAAPTLPRVSTSRSHAARNRLHPQRAATSVPAAARRSPVRAALAPAAGRNSATAAPAVVLGRNPLTTAVTIAELYWHAVPCGGQIRVVANAAIPAGLDPSTDAWVTFGSSQGANNLTAAPASYVDCTITLAHWQWATPADMENDWGMFCLTVTHEMGHLLGYQHSLAPGSVMAPVFTSAADVPTVCKSGWLPGRRPPTHHSAPTKR